MILKILAIRWWWNTVVPETQITDKATKVTQFNSWRRLVAVQREGIQSEPSSLLELRKYIWILQEPKPLKFGQSTALKRTAQVRECWRSAEAFSWILNWVPISWCTWKKKDPRLRKKGLEMITGSSGYSTVQI